MELVGRGDSDWASESGIRQSVSLRCTERDTFQLESETDRDQSKFMRSRVPRSQCLRRRIVEGSQAELGEMTT